MQFLLALSGVIPAVVLMAIMARFDAKRPEPKKHLYLATLFGALAVIPVIVIEVVLEKLNPGGFFGAFYKAYFVAGFVEEGAKAAVLYFVVWRSTAFDERLDGIVYATRAGLGFALVENVGYLLGAHDTGGFIGTFVLRAVLAVPGHAIWAGFMGYWAARKKFDGIGPGLWGGLALAVLMHGSYDCSIFLMPLLAKTPLKLLILPLLAVPVVVIVGGYRRLKKHALEALRLDDVTHAPRPLPRLPFGLGFVLR